MFRPIVAVIMILVLFVSGCASFKDTMGTIGMTIGGVAGAIAYNANPLAGAAIGSVFGAIFMQTVGHYVDRHNMDRREAINRLKNKQNYEQLSKGRGTNKHYNLEVLQIDSIEATPNMVSPGEKLVIKADYYVISSNAKQVIAVKETHLITNIYNEPVTKPFIRVTQKKQGLTTTSLAVPIPEEAQTDIYKVAFKVEIEGRGLSDTKETLFKVVKR